ncbi:hypothetical protein BSIN_0172 [Burkholderia singularis]|uniref:Uncharacterized protein n=1 Tax=Burkholderia singularis TaxID=1503053 RepID=A0A238H2J0_9BURK|nr:hypothetical protein BSIN_0172 [Burkholderia singularis]
MYKRLCAQFYRLASMADAGRRGPSVLMRYRDWGKVGAPGSWIP